MSTNTITRDFAQGNPNMLLMPWYVTGLVDGEGSFGFTITESKIRFEFKVTQKRINAGILYELEKYFKVGSVIIDNRSDETLKYHVTNREELINVILPHFASYPLVTSKKLNFFDFKKALLAVMGKDHIKGTLLDYVMALKAGMNKERSFVDKFNALSVIALQPEWVQAFVDGEGTFYPYVAIKKTPRSTYQGVDMTLEVGQASHDIAVLASLQAFFNGGYVSPKCEIGNIEAVLLIRAKSIYKLRNVELIIDFFNKYPLLTTKQLDFESFKSIWNIKSSGGHKTPEGLAKIYALKAGMNKGRIIKPVDTQN